MSQYIDDFEKPLLWKLDLKTKTIISGSNFDKMSMRYFGTEFKSQKLQYICHYLFI